MTPELQSSADTAAAPALLVWVSCPAAIAATLARGLIDARLAACVNIVPQITSIYRWQGAIEQAEESQLIIKTTRDRYPALQESLRAAHPYELPEIVAVEISSGLPAYLQWIHDETH